MAAGTRQGITEASQGVSGAAPFGLLRATFDFADVLKSPYLFALDLPSLD